MTRADAAAILDERRRTAEAILDEAVRAEVLRFLDSEVEARLRARPHFRDRVPSPALVELRRDIDSAAADLAAAFTHVLADLRVWYGANEATESEEAEAVERVFEPLTAKVEELLRTYGFPGDERADDAEDRSLDLEAEYALDHRLSPTLVWAWRRLRALDTARNQLADARDGPPEPTFELRFLAPEALDM